jgi:hypothetical protein
MMTSPDMMKKTNYQRYLFLDFISSRFSHHTNHIIPQAQRSDAFVRAVCDMFGMQVS